jgi:hypothetical protein
MRVDKVFRLHGRQCFRSNIKMCLLKNKVSNGLIGDSCLSSICTWQKVNRSYLFALRIAVLCGTNVKTHRYGTQRDITVTAFSGANTDAVLVFGQSSMTFVANNVIFVSVGRTELSAVFTVTGDLNVKVHVGLVSRLLDFINILSPSRVVCAPDV